jgi:hypothetical protein
MHKSFRLAVFLIILCAAVSGQAAATNAPVKGLSLFTCAHSFHAFVPGLLADIAKSAGIENHVQIGRSGIGGSQVIEHWDVPEEKKSEKRFSRAYDARPLLREGKVDVLTLSPIWFPDPGLDNFGELAYAHNRDIRIMVNEFWIPNDVYEPVYPLLTGKVVDHNAATIPELAKQQVLYCQDMQNYLAGLNARLGKNIFYMVPVGHAVVALREKIITGKAPGISTQEQLFKDDWGHPQMPIQVLAAYCFYACIYGQSPVGLPPVEKWQLNPELVRLLQELAWGAVTHHPLTGLPAKSSAD